MWELTAVLEAYKNARIAIYGLSAQTKKILSELGDAYQVVCLLDGYKKSGSLYGKPILSLEEAVQCGVKLILVAARPSSTRIIVNRILRVCAENKIALFDTSGHDLRVLKRETYDLKGLDGPSKSQLRDMLMKYDAVSVDLFDTLVMRRVLFSADVFDVAAQRLRQQGYAIEDFSGKRLESEQTLARTRPSTLGEIYTHMAANYSIRSITPEELAELEWKTDCELMVPRRELCDLLNELYALGKEIYIVSDTYYSGAQLAELLERSGVRYTGILASCEFRTGKAQQLFQVLRDKLCGKSCMHLGDDPVSDLHGARRYGFHSQRIYSGIDLFEHAGYLGMWDNTGDLPGRIRLGLLVSRLFNSPFRFETPERAVGIGTAYDIGFLCFAPLICDFVIWFQRQVTAYGLQNIWFCARDGYLPKKLYDMLDSGAASVYFLTSRAAAVRAGVENPEDIQKIAELRFDGTLHEQVKERFGLTEYVGDGGLSDYTELILSKAAENKKRYQRYIRTLDVRDGDIAFFDFVARGTVQRHISRLVDHRLRGFYFLFLADQQNKSDSLEAVSFCTLEDGAGDAVWKDYSILEAVLTSPEPMVVAFSEAGEPCCAEESRTEQDLRCIQSVQEGITDYFKAYLAISPEWRDAVNLELDGKLLSLIHKIPVFDHEFLSLKVEDPFFNRIADVSDLL